MMKYYNDIINLLFRVIYYFMDKKNNIFIMKPIVEFENKFVL